MASRIQGITVEIGGDTTKLTTALKGVNSEIRNTQSQLRDVEKLLKLDPGNTELLAQRQRLLNEEVQATKEKLEALKTASEQANDALEQGTITQSQYDALQREIIATEQALEDLDEQAEQSAVIWLLTTELHNPFINRRIDCFIDSIYGFCIVFWNKYESRKWRENTRKSNECAGR